jgi:Concanavalin A-like lectin/glucanases superfamily
VSAYGDTVRAMNPALYLPLDRAAVNGYALDGSGNDRNGLLGGGMLAGGYSPGPLSEGGAATDFDGANDDLAVTYPTRRNLAKNPRLGDGTLGQWGGGVPTPTLVQAPNPTAEMKAAGITTAVRQVATASFDYASVSCDLTTIAGHTYVTSAWVYLESIANTNDQIYVQLNNGIEATGAGPAGYSQIVTGTQTGQWIRLASVGAFSTALACGFISGYTKVGGAAAAAVWYVTGVLAEEASTVGTYFDGSRYIPSSGASFVPSRGQTGWLGTAHASASDLGCFANGTARTFCGWAYRDTSTSYDFFFTTSEPVTSSARPRCYLNINDTMFIYELNATDGGVVWPGAWPGNGQWVHWALVADEPNNAFRLYINGALVSEQPTSFQYRAISGGAVLTFASEHSWDGKHAHFAIFERGLTLGEIIGLYKAGRAGISAGGDGLVGTRRA